MRSLLLDIYDYFFYYFTSSYWEDLLMWFKVISALVSAAFLGGIIFLWFKVGALWGKINAIKEGMEPSAGDKEKIIAKKIDKKWRAILEKMEKGERGDKASLSMALIEADKIFDDLLKQIGYQGETVSEKLKQLSSAQLPNIEDIWWAHKLRNNVVHNPEHSLNFNDAKRAIRAFEEAFKHYQVL